VITVITEMSKLHSHIRVTDDDLIDVDWWWCWWWCDHVSRRTSSTSVKFETGCTCTLSSSSCLARFSRSTSSLESSSKTSTCRRKRWVLLLFADTSLNFMICLEISIFIIFDETWWPRCCPSTLLILLSLLIAKVTRRYVAHAANCHSRSVYW